MNTVLHSHANRTLTEKMVSSILCFATPFRRVLVEILLIRSTEDTEEIPFAGATIGSIIQVSNVTPTVDRLGELLANACNTVHMPHTKQLRYLHQLQVSGCSL